MTKVDLLEHTTHWKTMSELASVLPIMSSLGAHLVGDEADVSTRIAELRPEGELVLTIQCGMQSIFGALPARGVRLEARMQRAVEAGSNLRDHLGGLNDALNNVFFGLVPEDQLSRFGGGVN